MVEEYTDPEIMMENFGSSSTSEVSSESFSVINSATASSNSPVPLPLMEERKNIFSKIFFQLMYLKEMNIFYGILMKTRK